MSSLGPWNASSTAEEVTQGCDLTGKTALVTGASGGIGAETARVLALRGAEVWLAVRDAKKGETVARSIKANLGKRRCHVMSLDLTKGESISACAKEVLERQSTLNLLINNAGIMACPLARTASGFELQFATNHLGHYLFTRKLERLLRTSGTRIVNVSSAAHLSAGVDLTDLNFSSREYSKWPAYGQSKTANILFTLELRRRWSECTSFSLHPGVIQTDLARHLPEAEVQKIFGARFLERSGGLKTIPQGAATSLIAATHPALNSESGFYLEDCQVAGPQGQGPTRFGYAAHAADADAAVGLWEQSELLWKNAGFASGEATG